LLDWNGTWPNNNYSDLKVLKNIGKIVKSPIIIKKIKVEKKNIFY
jgi:hypothetical protein